MGLLAPPPSYISLPLHNSTVMPYRLGDGSCMVGQAIYQATYCGALPGTEIIFKWDNPAVTSIYTSANLPTGSDPGATAQNVSNIVYDATNDCIYALFGDQDDGTNDVLFVAKVNPHDLTNFMLVDGYPLYADTFQESTNPAIATDGTFIYVLIGGTDQNSWLYKFNCSDGSFVAKLQIANATGLSSMPGPQCLVYQSGNLYCAGNSWMAVVPTSLGSQTAIATGTASNNDDMVLTPDGYVWQGSESLVVTRGTVVRVKQDMSAASIVTLGPQLGIVTGGCWVDSTFFDGTNLWFSLVRDPLAGLIVKTDLSGNVLGFTTLQSNEIHMNEMFVLPSGVWTSSYNASALVPSKVVFTPTGVDPTATPRPPLGHGATV